MGALCFELCIEHWALGIGNWTLGFYIIVCIVCIAHCKCTVCIMCIVRIADPSACFQALCVSSLVTKRVGRSVRKSRNHILAQFGGFYCSWPVLTFSMFTQTCSTLYNMSCRGSWGQNKERCLWQYLSSSKTASHLSTSFLSRIFLLFGPIHILFASHCVPLCFLFLMQSSSFEP